jgi:hypothetical protein
VTVIALFVPEPCPHNVKIVVVESDETRVVEETDVEEIDVE